jgi:hypothetical protein
MIAQLALLVSLLGNVNEEKVLINHILEAKTEKHWILDRKSDKNVVSIAATGVGFYAYARAAKLGMISREDASKWINDGFMSMIGVNFENDGWLYHFVDRTGKPYEESEVSSIDSVIFYLGAERAAQELGEPVLIDYVRKCKGKISTAVMLDKDGYFYHGWTMENGRRNMLKYKWRNYSEGILIYRYFDLTFKPVYTHYDLPLFVYFYPLAFYPEERSWVDNLGKAIDYQLSITGHFGYTACDGPNGYQVNTPYIISPLAIFSCKKFFPAKVEKELNKRSAPWSVQAITVNHSWQTGDRVLMDDGMALMLMKGK